MLRLRDRFQRETHEHTSDAETLEQADPEFTARASNESEFEALIAQVRAEEGLLAEVEAALGRMRDSTYGICMARKTPIPADRLRAIPWTRFCVEAAAERES